MTTAATTTTIVESPDLTSMDDDALTAHVRHLEGERDRLTADLPKLERAVIERTNACMAYDYFDVVRMLKVIDRELFASELEVEYRAREARSAPQGFDQLARRAMSGDLAGAWALGIHSMRDARHFKTMGR